MILKCIRIICTLFLSFFVLFYIDNEYYMLGVDHDKIILLSTPFPTIPMLGKNCCCGVIVFYVGNKRCCNSGVDTLGRSAVSVQQ